MKTLQNNFTTPEQSRRLLELGVPAKSADCFWTNPIGSKMYASPIVRNKITYRYKDWFKTNHYFYTPCWSVGRLIEIYSLCVTCDPNVESPMLGSGNNTELFVNMLEFAKHINILDFSKLEE